MPADVALMARLAGHEGEEAVFAHTASAQFARSDFYGLRATIERINQGAAAVGKAAQTPFVAGLPEVIGN